MTVAGIPILIFLTWFPALGAVVIMLVRGSEETVALTSRWLALQTSAITFLFSIGLWLDFDPAATGYQFQTEIPWLPGYGVSYRTGVDGISILFVLLSTFVIPVCIVSAWKAIRTRVRDFMVAFLLMETMLIGVFSTLDFVVFYIFFEGVLIPMYLVIGVWGGSRRVYSAYKFFLYTLTGSVLMVLALLEMWSYAGTADIAVLAATKFPVHVQVFLFLAFLASFAVKVPMWPVHTWLPDAHVEAPTAGSVVLAAVLLKMGGYGFLRFSLPMLPDASTLFAPLMLSLSVIAIIYTSMVAFAQTDMKKLIAYSSVAHMAVVTIGIFSFTQQGLDGAMYQMLSHGIVSAALFLCVGVLYDRMHTHEIARFNGLAHRMPLYAFFFMLFTLAGVGVPGMSGFVGEFLVIVGLLKLNMSLALLGGSGVILGIIYSPYLYRRVMFGRMTLPDLAGIGDLSWREAALFVPLVLLTLWMGIYPSSFGRVFAPSTAALVKQHVTAVAAASASTPAVADVRRLGPLAEVAR
ncbi:MAG: NADH-quinone oxidoreductase subunit M [Rhodopila sp.]